MNLFKHAISVLTSMLFIGALKLEMAKVTANVASDFGSQGVNDAKAILSAIAEGEGKMLDVMLSAAFDMAENPQASADYLSGLAKGLIDGGMTKGTAANRKSDCSAIFQAYYITLQGIILPEGTMADDPEWQSQKRIDAQEKMHEIEGGYHGVVKECRSIIAKHNGKGDGSGTSTRTTGARKISDSEGKKIAQRLLNADTTGSTAIELMTAAQTAYIKAAGTPEGLVRQADRLAMELQKSGDVFYKSLGEKLSKLTQAAIEHAEQERDAAKARNDEKLDNAKGGQPQASTTAEVQQAA